jgi:AcrR family transcriptional regulator
MFYGIRRAVVWLGLGMVRKYELKRRAEKQEETRRRITEATVELHQRLGPARTTVSAIAEKAGVQRLTVYRHFPDERALFTACTQHYMGANPPPDPAPWAEVPDPEERLRVALAEVYAYHGRTERMMSGVIRDRQVHPLTREFSEPYFRHWDTMREVLAVGWETRGGRREPLLAALGHALYFGTWQSLVRQQETGEERAIELMVCMVGCSARG